MWNKNELRRAGHVVTQPGNPTLENQDYQSKIGKGTKKKGMETKH